MRHQFNRSGWFYRALKYLTHTIHATHSALAILCPSQPARTWGL